MNLKPCPFCGGDAKVVSHHVTARVIMQGCCLKCGSMGPASVRPCGLDWYTDNRMEEQARRKAEEEWNRRAEEQHEA